MQLDVLDAARTLSQICRFGGKTRWFYSVAEHTVIGTLVMKYVGRGGDEIKAFMLHDLHEAIWGGDIIRPVRKMLPPEYHDKITDIDTDLAAMHGLKTLDMPVVHQVDDLMLKCELKEVATVTDDNHPFPENDPVANLIVQSIRARKYPTPQNAADAYVALYQEIFQ